MADEPQKNPCKDPEKVKRFEDLVALIYRDLYRFIYSIMRQNAASEDVLQNTLLTSFRCFGALRDQNRFKPWIFTIAKREALAFIRKGSKEIQTEEEELGQYRDQEPGSYEKGPEETLLENELSSAVTAAVNGLRQEMRDVIRLHYYNGLAFNEIADVMGINVNTVRTWHMRAKNEIGRFLEASHYTEGKTEVRAQDRG